MILIKKLVNLFKKRRVSNGYVTFIVENYNGITFIQISECKNGQIKRETFRFDKNNVMGRHYLIVTND